jgi:hypothetical protein
MANLSSFNIDSVPLTGGLYRGTAANITGISPGDPVYITSSGIQNVIGTNEVIGEFRSLFDLGLSQMGDSNASSIRCLSAVRTKGYNHQSGGEKFIISYVVQAGTQSGKILRIALADMNSGTLNVSQVTDIAGPVSTFYDAELIWNEDAGAATLLYTTGSSGYNSITVMFSTGGAFVLSSATAFSGTTQNYPYLSGQFIPDLTSGQNGTGENVYVGRFTSGTKVQVAIARIGALPTATTTMQTPVEIDGSGTAQAAGFAPSYEVRSTYNASTKTLLVSYAGTQYTTSGYVEGYELKVIAIDCSTGSMIVGSPVTLTHTESGSNGDHTIAYHPGEGVAIITYRDYQNGAAAQITTRTINTQLGNTNISFGEKRVIDDHPEVIGYQGLDGFRGDYNPNIQKVVVPGNDADYGTYAMVQDASNLMGTWYSTVESRFDKIYPLSVSKQFVLYDNQNSNMFCLTQDSSVLGARSYTPGNSNMTDGGGTGGKFIGFAANSASSQGDPVDVRLSGQICPNQSGLIAGSVYYVMRDGTLSTTPNAYRIKAGVALSTTELLIQTEAERA